MTNYIQPLVSVLMTSYNRSDYVADAISNVLASSYRNIELIVCDDNSTDDTVSIARQFERNDNRVRVFVHEQNIGDYANRNRAASYAHGEYIIYCDSDDILYPHAIEVFLWAFASSEDAALAFEDIHDISGAFPRRLSPAESYLRHFNINKLFFRAPGSVMLRREIFIESGGFREDLKQAGDFEFWFRICARHPIVLAPGMLHWVRSHPGQESKKSVSEQVIIRYKVVMNALNSKECPMEKELVVSIIHKTRRSALNTLFRHWIKGRISLGMLFKLNAQFHSKTLFGKTD